MDNADNGLITARTVQTGTVVAANGIEYAYRRFGRSTDGFPLVFRQHFRGNLDSWDPDLVDDIAAEREVILVDNAGVGASTGTVPGTVAEMARDLLAFSKLRRLTAITQPTLILQGDDHSMIRHTGEPHAGRTHPRRAAAHLPRCRARIDLPVPARGRPPRPRARGGQDHHGRRLRGMLMTSPTHLLDRVLEAHGGRARWAEVSTISAERSFGGAFWGLKQVAGVAERGRFTVDLRHQETSLESFGAPDVRTRFTADRVEMVRATEEGDEVIEAVDDPRTTFEGHVLETPWTRMQLAYFTGYAMWTYNTEPWSFTFPGVQVEEIGPWTEPDGTVLDRLRVTYPPQIATHTPTQTLYADADGVLRRRDYEVDIAGGSPSVEYMTDQFWADGLLLAGSRKIFVRDGDGTAIPDPLIVSIDISDVRLGSSAGTDTSLPEPGQPCVTHPSPVGTER